MTVTLIGNYGKQNSGDEAILASVVRQVRTIDEGARIVVLSDDPGWTKQMFEVEATARVPRGANRAVRVLKALRNLNRVVRASSAVVIGGGALIMDRYRYYPIFVFLVCSLCWLSRVRYGFFAVGVGPVRYSLSRKIFRICLRAAASVTVRDTRSLAAARMELGISGATMVHDPALFLPQERQEGTRVGIGLSILAYYNRNWAELDARRHGEYVQAMAEVVRGVQLLAPRDDITLICMTPGDEETAKEVVSLTGANRVSILRDPRPSSVIEKIASLRFVIAARLHVALLAVATATPFVGLAYLPKVEALLADLGLADLVYPLEDFKSDDFLRWAEAPLARPDRLVPRLRSVTVELSEEKNLQALEAILGRERR